jgi:bacterioferritin (cytochrome b1)
MSDKFAAIERILDLWGTPKELDGASIGEDVIDDVVEAARVEVDQAREREAKYREALALLAESLDYIGGDWLIRRNAAIVAACTKMGGSE